MAQQKIKEKFLKKINKKSEKDLSLFESISLKNHLRKTAVTEIEPQMTNDDQFECIANRIKLKRLFEMYENLVDKKMIEEIFKKKK